MTKTTDRRKSVLGLTVWERGAPQAGEPRQQAASMVTGPGSWALASSLKVEQRQHTGSGIRPHDLKPAFSSDILPLVRLYLQNLPKEVPQTIQTSEPMDTVSFKSLHGHFLIFKWYLFSLTPINRLCLVSHALIHAPCCWRPCKRKMASRCI